MTRLVIRALFCVFLAAIAAQAGITTSDVRVHITNCGNLKDVDLVINGEDLKQRRVQLTVDKKAGDCHWQVNLGGSPISTSVAHFSFRAGSVRSGCQMANPDQTETFAYIEFSCCVEGPVPNVSPFRNLSVRVEPPMKVSYGRDVPPFGEDRILGVQCLEAATFDDGRGPILNALLAREQIYLDLGPLNRKQVKLGLHLNDIVGEDGTRILTLDGVTFRLMVQRAQGKMRSAPGFSSNAITLDIKKLEALKFERAEFEVIK